MKIIAVSAVTAGGKTTAVNAVKEKLPRCTSLHFDDYSFEGEVDDFHQWVLDGTDYNVWNLSPLKADIENIISSGEYDYLLLDYPFAYAHRMIRQYLDCCIFLDTPLDIAMARRVLRDMQAASGDEIRQDMETYLQYARPAYVHMREEQLAAADYVLDGAKATETLVQEAAEIILHC